jgi:uncharacterized protein
MYSGFESQFITRMERECRKFPDPSHDILHVKRVVATAKQLAQVEGANLDIVVPAAYLHDLVLISKSDPRRSQASKLSADEAGRFLAELGYSADLIPAIQHAIEAHSFSAGIPADTIEAKVVQDADRLDGLGAIGIARCFSMSGLLSRDFYSAEDPFCLERVPDDQKNSLDHFFVKLFRVPSMLQTDSGRREGLQRLQFLQAFMEQLRREI